MTYSEHELEFTFANYNDDDEKGPRLALVWGPRMVNSALCAAPMYVLIVYVW